MTHDISFDNVEELRRRSEEFLSQHERHGAPEELWWAAGEIAGRRRMDLVCRCLRFDYHSLKKLVGNGARQHGGTSLSRNMRRGKPVTRDVMKMLEAATQSVVRRPASRGFGRKHARTAEDPIVH